MKINDFTADLAADDARRALPSALFDGIDAIKKDAAKGGPQRWLWPSEGDTEKIEVGGGKTKSRYDLKLKALRIRNTWRESLVSLAAMPFDERAALDGWPTIVQGTETVPGVVARLDDQGSDLDTIWAQSFLLKWARGIHFQLVDMPAPGPDGKPLVNATPYWVSIDASQVKEAECELYEDRHRLVSLRLDMPRVESEGSKDDPNDWTALKVIPRVRLYRRAEGFGQPAGGPVMYRDSELDENSGKWVWRDEPRQVISRFGATVLADIPLIPFYSTRSLEPYRDLPPFEDTASEQAAHIRKMCDYDARVSNDARNSLYVAGADLSSIKAGANFITGPKDSRPYLLETTGAAAESLRADMVDIENAIRRGNLRPLMAEAGIERTATEIVAQSISASSRLEMSILLDAAAITQGLRWTSTLIGAEAENGTVGKRTDFAGMGSDINVLAQAWSASGGTPSDLDFWTLAHRSREFGLSEKDDPKQMAQRSRAQRNEGAL